MRTALVNHGGVIQKKIMISTLEDLQEYGDLYDKSVACAFEGILISDKSIDSFSNSENPEQRWMAGMHGNGKCLIENAATMTSKKLIGMLKVLRTYGTIAVNEAGGYCGWNDSCMSIITDNVPADRKFAPQSNINESKYLVIENQSEVSEKVDTFVKNIDRNYSSITDLRYAEEGEFEKLLKYAMSKKCDTIIFETTLIDQKQVHKMAQLFKSLPKFTFMIFDYSSDGLENVLSNVIGEDEAKSLMNKHNIIINPSKN